MHSVEHADTELAGVMHDLMHACHSQMVVGHSVLALAIVLTDRQKPPLGESAVHKSGL